MLLSSTKQCPRYSTYSASFNQKNNLWVRCYQLSRFIDEETEARVTNKVINKWKRLFLVSVFFEGLKTLRDRAMTI